MAFPNDIELSKPHFCDGLRRLSLLNYTSSHPRPYSQFTSPTLTHFVYKRLKSTTPSSFLAPTTSFLPSVFRSVHATGQLGSSILDAICPQIYRGCLAISAHFPQNMIAERFSASRGRVGFCGGRLEHGPTRSPRALIKQMRTFSGGGEWWSLCQN